MQHIEICHLRRWSQMSTLRFVIAGQHPKLCMMRTAVSTSLADKLQQRACSLDMSLIGYTLLIWNYQNVIFNVVWPKKNWCLFDCVYLQTYVVTAWILRKQYWRYCRLYQVAWGSVHVLSFFVADKKNDKRLHRKRRNHHSGRSSSKRWHCDNGSASDGQSSR